MQHVAQQKKTNQQKKKISRRKSKQEGKNRNNSNVATVGEISIIGWGFENRNTQQTL